MTKILRTFLPLCLLTCLQCSEIFQEDQKNKKSCPEGPEEVSSTDFFTPPLPDCPSTYNESCCTKKSLEIPSLECQYPWRIWNKQACLGGFYKKTNSSVKPCPAGYYCPEDRTCLVPCQSGAYCPKSRLVPFEETYGKTKFVNPICGMLDMCCLPYNQAPIKRRDWYVCGGSAVADVCPPGYYCPNTTTKMKCPSGHFCAQGSIKPRTCPIFTYCAEGQSSPKYSAFGIILDLIFLVLGAIFILLKRYSEKVKYLVPWVWNKQDTETTLEISEEEEYKLKHLPLTIRFFNLSCTLKNKSKRVLLSKVSGEIRPFCMTAIVGPSGCGKTTLINVLCGKANYGDIEGHVLINGKDEPIGKYKKAMGFVPQEDTMHYELTVREELTYQAKLRLPSCLSTNQLKERVNRVIGTLKLNKVADDIIGDKEMSTGLSSGERKRVSIGMELISDPQILILDEPTSGLDSSSSLVIIRILKSVADRGITICTVLHQPRYEIFEMFDHLILLGQNGQTVYQGAPVSASDYFSHIGFPLPPYMNPPDFYLDVVSGDVAKDRWDPESLPHLWEEYYQENIVAPIEDQWDISFSNGQDDTAVVSPEVDQLLLDNTFKLEGESERDKCLKTCLSMHLAAPECLRQLWILLRRTVICQARMWSTLLLDQLMILLCGFVLGTLFCEVPIVKFLAFISLSGLSVGLMNIVSSLRCFGQQRHIYWRESSVGVNKLSFFLAVNIAQLPVLIITPLTYLSVCYTLAAPRSSFGDFYIVFLAFVFTVSGLGYALSILFKPRNSQVIAVILLLVSAMCSGSQKRLCYMDSFTVLGPLSYKISYSKYACQALFETEAAEFPDVMRGLPDFIAAQNHYTLDEFWWCVGILVLMGVMARVAAFLALVFRNKQKEI